MHRAYNFSAGPATLPLEVLEEAQRELVDYRGSGMSIMEMSHRGKEYAAVHDEAVDNVRRLLQLPEGYTVLLLQGGASGQFYMLPMNMLTPDRSADYLHSGAWAKKAIQEARLFGGVRLAADTSKAEPARMPLQEELDLDPEAVYLHLTSNETIAGTRYQTFPEAACPLVADMSSDILSRPLDVRPFGLVYAGAQKNLGPSGVTLVIVREDWLAGARTDIPSFLRYELQAKENSMVNTPPCFSIYILMLVTRWVLQQGGVESMARRNEAKAALLYEAIDASGGFYRGTAHPEHRSTMNVTFRLPDEEREQRFLAAAAAKGLLGLKGHRSVGGMRASIYNAFPREGVDALVAFMQDFQEHNG